MKAGTSLKGVKSENSLNTDSLQYLDNNTDNLWTTKTEDRKQTASVSPEAQIKILSSRELKSIKYLLLEESSAEKIHHPYSNGIKNERKTSNVLPS